MGALLPWVFGRVLRRQVHYSHKHALRAKIMNNCHTFSSTKILKFKIRYLENREKIGQERRANLSKRDNVVSDEFQKLPRSLQRNENTSLSH